MKLRQGNVFTCVCHSVHRGGQMWQGACMGGMCGKGACVAGGMHGRGHALQWGMCGKGHVWQGACVAGEMATAAGGMHPTGMHSCLDY